MKKIDFFDSFNSQEPARGDLLISEPFLPDPNFERSVVMLCEHDENGSFGFVLNHLSTLKLEEVIEDSGEFNGDLFVGGPVQQDTLHIIHRCPDLIDGGQKINEGIYWGGDFEKLIYLLNTKQVSENDVRFFIGYSGWSEGQLLEEMGAKSWIVYKDPTSEEIFDQDANDLWRNILKDMGGKFKMFANYPTDPRLN
ncbi:MAG: YqgE/AlgH family protein [Cyclobacteriaceae bacterium]